MKHDSNNYIAWLLIKSLKSKSSDWTTLLHIEEKNHLTLTVISEEKYGKKIKCYQHLFCLSNDKDLDMLIKLLSHVNFRVFLLSVHYLYLQENNLIFHRSVQIVLVNKNLVNKTHVFGQVLDNQLRN